MRDLNDDSLFRWDSVEAEDFEDEYLDSTKYDENDLRWASEIDNEAEYLDLIERAQDIKQYFDDIYKG